MKININHLLSAFLIVGLSSCGGKVEKEAIEHTDHAVETVHFTSEQFDALDMKVGPLALKNLSAVVQASGQLEVPPQNEATVTAVIGANVFAIQVIEGDDVKKGQILAYLRHPNLVRLQGDYLEAYNNLLFLEQDYKRQQRLYEEEVGSGKSFQQTEASYRSVQGSVKSYEAQLKQFGMNPARIQQGNLYDEVPVVSPIDGSIVKVAVKTGQYVQPEKTLFEIVNINHIHADLMVYEKDVYKVKKGQRIRFSVEMQPGEDLYAEIYSVGKKFEENPKAVHVHAEIENKVGQLIPGMYIKGEILTDSATTRVLPEAAVIRDGDKHFAFVVQNHKQDEKEDWLFTPIEVRPGITNDRWVAVEFLEEVASETAFALNNAYYLWAEMKKGEGGHEH